MINFNILKNIYNYQIDMILSNNGLTVPCILDYGISKKNLCSNCIFDSLTNKSSNMYQSGGPIPFDIGRICPYCNGIGYYGENSRQDEIYMAVIYDHKSWIKINDNIKITDGSIQTICKSEYLAKIQSVNNLIINENFYKLDGKPSYGGLDSMRYIISIWTKTNAI
jgi:hypothetical protein